MSEFKIKYNGAYCWVKLSGAPSEIRELLQIVQGTWKEAKK